MSQRFSLYDDLSAAENLVFYAMVYGVPGRLRRERIDRMIQLADLVGREDTLAGQLSGGYRQRLALACALVHSPRLMFLDEPTAGVDPVSRRTFWELIRRLADSGVTVVVTTHYMDEAEHCDRLGFIYQGRLIAQGTPAAIKADAFGRPVFQVESPEPRGRSTSSPTGRPSRRLSATGRSSAWCRRSAGSPRRRSSSAWRPPDWRRPCARFPRRSRTCSSPSWTRSARAGCGGSSAPSDGPCVFSG